MDLRTAALSDRGRVRSRNEDAFLLAPERGLFAVADGMGGHAGGEVASRLALDSLDEALGAAAAAASADTIAQALARAHLAILEHARRDPSLAGMGTTLTALKLEQQEAIVAHVGDSRAYRLREGRLEQLTVDHTVVQGYVDQGEISALQARTHRLRHILTRALGADEEVEVEVDVGRAATEAGDLFLLCSDGLTGMVDDADLEAMLAQPRPLDQLARQLVDAANLRGGDDNVTVVLVRLE